MKEALIIFARNPESGKVKSRIAQDTSPEFALNCYRELLAHTLHLGEGISCQRLLFFSDHLPPASEYAQYELHRQRGEDLGQRMEDAIRLALHQGAQKVVVIGSDCQELTRDFVELAFKRLDDHEVVLGPALDGGYYLLGMRKLYHLLFEDKPWGESTLFAETLKDLQELQLAYSLLDPLRDVDHLEDISSELMRRINDQCHHSHAQ